MTKRTFITLAVALLGFIATKAQQPFTGRVEYEFVFKTDDPSIPKGMVIEYGPTYMKMMSFDSKNSASHQYEMEMVIDHSSGQMYAFVHDAKKVIIKKNPATPVQPEMIRVPKSETTIAGIKASLYNTRVNGSQFYEVWLSDSIRVSTSDLVAKDSDFFIFGTGKILLKAAPKTEQVLKGELQDMTIKVVKITPLVFSDSIYQLPKDYTIEDEAALSRMQDSLLQQFKAVDSAFAQQQLNEDSVKWVADEINSHVNKKPPSPKKPQKKAPTKGSKPVARRPKQ